MAMQDARVPLFVRLPANQAAALDRLVDTTGRHKQQVVSDLLGEGLELGRIELREGDVRSEVLTLAELAELLRVSPEAVEVRLGSGGGPPGRRLGTDWRFAREAVMAWLGAGEQPPEAPAAPGSEPAS
jgi:excisionase family DNA binding protein